MSPERQRVVIAELCPGISFGIIGPGEPEVWKWPSGAVTGDPLNDLNAMHQAKRKLLTNRYLCNVFNDLLIAEKPARPLAFETDKWTWGQSAEVEARALIKALNIWEDA